MRALMVTTILGALIFGSGCGADRRSEPLTGTQPVLTAEELIGQRVFMRECNSCHPQGAAGLGPALNDKPIPAAFIKLQVRVGFGAMPSFSDDDITEAELDALVAYISETGAPWGG
jgi:mono/diheme cytochrome c family protein